VLVLRGEARADEQQVVANLASLEDLVRRPDFELIEIIVMDEFTHDVVMRRGEERYLVFDTT
jgi:hypothetical protein